MTTAFKEMYVGLGLASLHVAPDMFRANNHIWSATLVCYTDNERRHYSVGCVSREAHG